MTLPESHVRYFGKKFQTLIVRHTGYRRIVKWAVPTKEIVSDTIKLYQNHPIECEWCKA